MEAEAAESRDRGKAEKATPKQMQKQQKERLEEDSITQDMLVSANFNSCILGIFLGDAREQGKKGKREKEARIILVQQTCGRIPVRLDLHQTHEPLLVHNSFVSFWSESPGTCMRLVEEILSRPRLCLILLIVSVPFLCFRIYFSL